MTPGLAAAGTLAEGRRRARLRVLADQSVRGDPGAAISRKGCGRLKGLEVDPGRAAR
jgi:hypothetical protein